MKLKLPRNPRPVGARKEGLRERMGSAHASPASHGYVKSFDGTKLFYSVEGRGKPLIFCYGLICSSLHWTYQISHFRKNYQTIWFDYRGHQNSDMPKNVSSITLENLARDLGTILDELNVEDAVILGHSMGVNVVLEFYRQQPKRVAAMVLANGTGQRPLENAFGNNFLQASFSLLKAAHHYSPELVSFLWKSSKSIPLTKYLVTFGGFNPHLTPPEDIDLYIRQVAETDPSILVQLIQNYEAYDASAWLHQVDVPTLILAGENDLLIPVEQQELLHQLIPESQLEVIRHGSHCPQMDLPDLVNLKIERFLDSINGRAKPSRTKASASRSKKRQELLVP